MKPQPRQSAAEEAHASQKDDIFSGLSPASMEDCLAFLGDEVGCAKYHYFIIIFAYLYIFLRVGAIFEETCARSNLESRPP